MFDDPRLFRERHQDLEGNVDRVASSGPDASQAVLVTTTTVTTYPTVAGSFYACNETEIGGHEIEGQAASYTPDTNGIIYALNIGTSVPPIGTRLVAHNVGGRWCFRYDS